MCCVFKSFDKFVERGNHSDKFFLFACYLDDFVAKTFRDVLGLLAYFDAFFRQRDDALAGVFLAFGAFDQPRFLHALQERSDGVGFQKQLVCDVVHRLLVLLPQH